MKESKDDKKMVLEKLNKTLKREKMARISQIFSNFNGIKAIYKEGSVRCIIWIEKLETTEDEFIGTANLLSIIDEINPNDESRIPSKWTFSSAWGEGLGIHSAGLKADYLWCLWIEPAFVVEIEKLVTKRDFKKACFRIATNQIY